jgi:hypothetical protein
MKTSDIFHKLSIEELNIRSNSNKEMPVIFETLLNPNSHTFQSTSSSFALHTYTTHLTFISFSHNKSLEIYLNFPSTETSDSIFSFSFEIFINTKRVIVISSINLSYKRAYLLCKANIQFPVDIILKGQYEKLYTSLVQQILWIKPEDIEDNGGVLDPKLFSLILSSDFLAVKEEDEVLEMIGIWSNTNISDELNGLLGLVRWTYVSSSGLLGCLKYPLLKTFPGFKSVFKREMLIHGGTVARQKNDKPRRGYKMEKGQRGIKVLMKEVMEYVFPSIEQQVRVK